MLKWGAGPPYKDANPPQMIHWYFETDDYYKEALAHIEAAKSRIWIEMYKIEDDHFGNVFVEALCKKALQGVRVRLIIDAVGSRLFPSHLYAKLIRSGVLASWYHPVMFLFFKNHHPNRRNHRKVMIIDKIAFVSSANISDQCSVLEFGDKRWHEVGIRVEGELVERLVLILKRALIYKLYKKGRKLSADRELDILWTSHLFNQNLIRKHILRLIKKSRNSIDIVSAYFIPDRATRRELARAIRRGVKVRVITNVADVSDVPIVWRAGRILVRKLMRHGVQFYTAHRMVHSKFIVVDHHLAIAGSSNINYRSFYRDAELNLIVRKPKYIKPLWHEFETLVKECRLITEVDVESKSWLDSIADRFLLALRHYL